MGKMLKKKAASRIHDYELSENNFIKKARLNVNDLMQRRKEEKKKDFKMNILIFSGASAVAVIALAIISL